MEGLIVVVGGGLAVGLLFGVSAFFSSSDSSALAAMGLLTQQAATGDRQ
jgi:hypothetical protein